MTEQKKSKPFYAQTWFILLIAIVVVKFILPSSEQKEFSSLMTDGKEAMEVSDYETAKLIGASALEVMPDSKSAKSLFEQAEIQIARMKKSEGEIKDEEVNQEKSNEQRSLNDRLAADYVARVDGSTADGNAELIAYNVFKDSYTPPGDIVTSAVFEENGKVLTVTVKGKDGWSDKSIGLGFYEDSTSVYRELAKDKRIEEAWLTITFPMKDIYGNAEDKEVMSTWMSREAMDAINWGSFDYQKLLDVVDGKSVYPQFVQ